MLRVERRNGGEQRFEVDAAGCDGCAGAPEGLAAALFGATADRIDAPGAQT